MWFDQTEMNLIIVLRWGGVAGYDSTFWWIVVNHNGGADSNCMIVKWAWLLYIIQFSVFIRNLKRSFHLFLGGNVYWVFSGYFIEFNAFKNNIIAHLQYILSSFFKE